LITTNALQIIIRKGIELLVVLGTACKEVKQSGNQIVFVPANFETPGLAQSAQIESCQRLQVLAGYGLFGSINVKYGELCL
jgi:hypothetical protein